MEMSTGGAWCTLPLNTQERSMNQFQTDRGSIPHQCINVNDSSFFFLALFDVHIA
jgi:hypothetical protein